MQVRKFEAADTPEAIRAVKKTLGEDAIILSTRTLKRKGGSVVEVTAAVDRDGESMPQAEAAAVGRDTAGLPIDVESRERAGPVEERIYEELGALRGMMHLFLQWMPSGGTQNGSEGATRAYLSLLAKGVDDRHAMEVIQKALDVQQREGKSGESLASSIRKCIGEGVECAGSITIDGDGPKVVAMVGPSGVGKTTTIAKLAARFSLLEGRSVGIITVDNYRIAAAEQIRIYAEIMGIPALAAGCAVELRNAIDKLSDRDIIFIDTAGRNHRTRQSVGELVDLFGEIPEREIHLVMSATTSRREMFEIMEGYEGLNVDRLLFTKLDESGSFGPIVSLLAQRGLPLSYLTGGQRVPEDIDVGCAAKLVDNLLAVQEVYPLQDAEAQRTTA